MHLNLKLHESEKKKKKKKHVPVFHDLTYRKQMTNKCNWEKKDIHVPILTYTNSHTVNIWQKMWLWWGKKPQNIDIFTNIFYMENI